MNGLFSTLVAAAQGRADPAEPPSRARFEMAGSVKDGIEWREESINDTPNRLPTSVQPNDIQHPSSRPAPSRNTGASPLISPVTEAHQQAQPIPPIHPGQTRAALLPLQEISVKDSLLTRGSEASSIPPDWETEKPMEWVYEPTLPRHALHPVAPENNPVSPFTPLLQPQETLTATEAPIASPPVNDRDIALQDRESFILKIGRIEVRPAATASGPPSRTAMWVSTHPVALPRAAIRQSLDEYRARQKR